LNNIKEFKERLLKLFKEFTEKIPEKLKSINVTPGTKVYIKKATYTKVEHLEKRYIGLTISLYLKLSSTACNGYIAYTEASFYAHFEMVNISYDESEHCAKMLEAVLRSLTGVELFVDKYNIVFDSKIKAALFIFGKEEEIIARGIELIKQYPRTIT